jgi:DNA-binding response OmpR family regulator
MKNISLTIFGSKIFFNLIKELDFAYNIFFEKSKTLKNEDDCNIRIIFPEDLDLKNLNNLLQKNTPTILLLDNKNYILKNKIRLLSFHMVLYLPIELTSFNDILKILYTKYFFLEKSNIVINNYNIDSNQRIIFKNNIKAKLTEKEIKLILTLNNQNGLDKLSLLKKVWNHNSDLDSHAFETHLHRLRKKIYKFFKDKNFILERNSLYYLKK